MFSQVKFQAAQSKVLVSLLQDAVLDATQQNATFALVKVLVEQRVVVSEMYDLMDTMTDISVKSLRPTARQAAGQIVARFIFHYPMGEKRLAHHLKKVPCPAPIQALRAHCTQRKPPKGCLAGMRATARAGSIREEDYDSGNLKMFGG